MPRGCHRASTDALPPARLPRRRTIAYELNLSLTKFASLLALILVLFTPGCSDDDGGARGDVVCSGSECQCPGTGDCEVDCRSDCDLSCTGSGDCAFSCGGGCLASCPGSGACTVDVGDDSTVVCSGSGGCDVDCDGDCTVECPGSGVCIARCEPETSCEITRCDDMVMCPDGVVVCHGPCPASGE